MPGGTDTRLSYRDQALADASVPQALKDLLTRIIPEKRFDDLRELVHEGVIDPLLVPEKFPLMSAVSQVMASAEWKEWLPVLFSAHPESLSVALMPKGYYDTSIANYTPNEGYRSAIEKPQLLSWLLQRGDTPVLDIVALMPIEAAPQMLETTALPRYGNSDKVPEPLFHHIFNTNEMTVANLDKIERMTGGSDFLKIKNARGETMFHRIVSQANWKEDDDKLDLASWMLQRNPQLVNEPDRFGWTPLDRFLSHTQGVTDNSMGRLLIASGARLDKQIAPKFNLATELDERSGKRLDKPQIRKLSGPSTP